MKITQTMAHQLVAATATGHAEQPPAQAVADVVEHSKDSRTADGRLRVIVTAPQNSIFQVNHDLHDRYGANLTSRLPLIHGVAATMTASAVERLLHDQPGRVQVFLDQKMHLPMIPEQKQDPLDRPAQPKLNVAIPTLGVDQLWTRGYDGAGVGIAILDSGIYPHADLADRIVAFKDFINDQSEPYDDHGHGTHVASDAAGSGKASDGKYKGTAPRANLIGAKVLDQDGSGYLSAILDGLQWVVDNKERYNVRVLNMSMGMTADSSYKENPVALALQEVVKQGIVACLAGGNEGPDKETVDTPGNAPLVITVGAINDHRTVSRDDDTVAKFSSRGPTAVDHLRKPDLLSPGANITACNAPGSELDKNPKVPHVGKDYISISGTSMATPIVAGIVADLAEANPRLTPQDIKRILKTTADRMPDVDRDSQGFGVVNAPRALERALQAAH